MARLRPTHLLGLLVLACGQPSAPAPAIEPAPAAPPTPPAPAATPAPAARLEDFRAQVVGMPAGQTSFDLWVPAQVTMNGAPIAQDMAMALLLDQLLSRGFFPRGFTEGNGGRTYHYRQGPPEAPGVPPAGGLLLVPRDPRVGQAYDVHAEHREDGGTSVLTADARVTVATVTADTVVLDVLATRATRTGAPAPLFTDVRFKLSIPTDRGAADFPGGHGPDGAPRGLEFVAPAPDEGTRMAVVALFNTFGFEACVLPKDPHAAGDKWSETTPIWHLKALEIAWEAGPVVVHAGGAFAGYDARWRIPVMHPTVTAPAYEVSLSVRTDDGFAGECDVKDFTLGPGSPTQQDHITSTRVAG